MTHATKTAQFHFEIRECRKADFDRLLPLFRELWPRKPLDPVALRAAYETGLISPSQAHICVVCETELIGFGSSMTDSVRYNCLRSPLVLTSSLTGRTSMLPTRAGGMCEAICTASSRLAASIR